MNTRTVAFVTRQAPDWTSLGRDWRGGNPIDPARYVPEEKLPAFPDRVDLLIEEWNRRFKIDFFTFRSILADLSSKNIASIEPARRLGLSQLRDVPFLALGGEVCVYFHDDDDFFAPNLPEWVQTINTTADMVVTPLFRVAPEQASTLCTKDGAMDFIVGDRAPFFCRYHTNNYGIFSRRCTSIFELTALKDHMRASAYANLRNYRDEHLASIVSGTVKTPGSAGHMLRIFSSEANSHRSFFEDFLQRASVLQNIPETYRWYSEPLKAVFRLVESVYRGDGYEAIEDLIPASPISRAPMART